MIYLAIDYMGKKTFSLAEHEIQEHGDVFIIAEAGVNHNQQLDIALKLVDIAAEAGADAVKFQTFKAEQVCTEAGEMAEYQKKNVGKVQSQREMLRGLELPEEFYPKIISRCKKRRILFMSTPHGGRASVDLLESFGVEVYKIGSGDLTNYILLERVAKTGKPIIMSSGMTTLKEVKDAIAYVRSKGGKKIAMLHCTTNYPCPPTEVNLKAMQTLMAELDVSVGYSDHTAGTNVALMAATLGMAVYEGHFTVDKSLPGPDHVASSDPIEFKERIALIRQAHVLLGSGKKIPFPSEVRISSMARRSLIAFKDMSKGHVITKGDLEAKRPGTGTSPSLYEWFIGKKLKHDMKADDQLSKSDVI